MPRDCCENIVCTPLSAFLTVPASAYVLIDTANAIASCAINPVTFIVCTVAGAILVSIGHIYMNNEMAKNINQHNIERMTEHKHGASSLFTLTLLFISVFDGSSYVSTAYFGSTMLGLRLGAMAAHAYWHGIHIKNTLQAPVAAQEN